MTMHAYRPASPVARGFTLVEALVAISITALAGSVLLLGVASSLQTTDEAMRQTIAIGLAQQLLNEIAGCHTMAEIDSYHDSQHEPPVDRFGIPLGKGDDEGGERYEAFQASDELLDRYLRTVKVHQVDAANLTAHLTTGTGSCRVVEVIVSYHAPNGSLRELARLQRATAELPSYEPIE